MKDEIDVLLVDDETSLLDQAKIFLKKEKRLDVITASSGIEGLKLLDYNEIDIIVSDYQMPEMNGLDFLEEVREKREMDIPFIIFTGKGREEVAMKALNLGADRYIRKGGDPKSQYQVLGEAIKQEKEHKKTKNRLQKTSRRFKAIFNDPTTFLGILDKDGKLLSANETSLQFIDGDQTDVKGKKFWNTPWWEHSEKLQNRLKEAVEKTREGKYDQFEATHVSEEGKEIFVDFHIRPVTNEDEEILSLIVEANDITERKEMEEKLKKLYEASTEIGGYHSESEVYRQVLNSTKEILDFEACTILMEENSELVVKATNSPNISIGEIYPKDEGIRGLTYQNKKSYLIRDLSDWDEAKPSDTNFKSAINIPIKDEGVFQALSYREGYFDESDLNLAETLISHMTQSIERIRSQEELKKRKRRYETIFQDNPEAIVEVNDEFEVVRVNEEFEDLFGYKENEILGKNLKYLIVPSDLIDEADRLGEQCEEGDYVEHETVRLTKDGEKIEVAMTARPVKYLKESHYVIVYRDITDLKKAESQIEERKEKLEKLHQASADLETCQSKEEIYTKAIEVAEDILEFDWCAINTPKKERLVTKKASGEYPEEESSYLFIQDSVAGKAFLENESYLHPSLSESKEASPTNDDYESGITVPIGKFGVFQAISSEEDDFDEDDLTMAELFMDHVKEALNRIEARETEEFLHSMLRHDLKNKSNIVQGYLQLVEEHDLDEEVESLIEKAVEANKEEKKMIEKVRKLREVEELEKEPVELVQVIEKMIEEKKEGVEDFELEIETDFSFCEIEGGPFVEELFENLVDNSIKHSEGGLVKISIEDKENEVLCQVEDNGKGIPEDIKDKIFDRGFKKGENAGSGLGMYLVKEIIDGYDGSIEVKDSELGGARFDVKLKRA